MFLPESNLPAEILLVEDDPALVRALSAVLRRSGYEVAVATHGRAAMDFLTKQRVSLVISDIFMPDGDGIELLNFLRRLTPHPPVITMSGGSESGVGNMLKVAGALGAARILAKPFSPGQLLSLVQELIGPPPARSAPPAGLPSPAAQ
jgi:CheY-like chemotaxis protein